MGLYDFFTHCQSDSASGIFFCRMQSLKYFENVLVEFWCNANTIIVYTNLVILSKISSGYFYFRGFISPIFYGIADQILKQAHQVGVVSLYFRKIGLYGNDGVALFDNRSKILHRLINYNVQVAGSKFCALCSGSR